MFVKALSLQFQNGVLMIISYILAVAIGITLGWILSLIPNIESDLKTLTSVSLTTITVCMMIITNAIRYTKDN